MSTTSPRTFVYAIGPAAGHWVKIGCSRDVQRRLEELRSTFPDTLHIHWTAPGGRSLEAALHRYFRRQRRRGEWFDLGYPDAAAMVAEAAALMGAPGTLRAVEVEVRVEPLELFDLDNTARQLRGEGLSYQQIGDRLGKSKTWAYNAVNQSVPAANGSP